MATPVTLREEKFSAQLERFPGIDVRLIPVPDLVALVEEGHTDDAPVEALLRPILEPLAGQLDAVVLGCTHYPFAARTVSYILGEDTMLLDGGIGTAIHTMHRLEEADLLWDGPGEVIFENSSQDPAMTQLCQRLLTEG
jgi:glutamate racemase